LLEGLFSNSIKEKILFFILQNGPSYPNEIATILDLTLFNVQKHLKQSEDTGVLVSHLKGKVRLYEFNKRYPFNRELDALLQKAFSFLPDEEKAMYYIRRRPRKPGKAI